VPMCTEITGEEVPHPARQRVRSQRLQREWQCAPLCKCSNYLAQSGRAKWRGIRTYVQAEDDSIAHR